MVKVSGIFKTIILLCTIIILRYLLLFPGEELIGNYEQRILVASVAVFLFFLTIFIIQKNKSAKDSCRWLARYLIPYFLVLGFSAVYTIALYDYSFKSIAIALAPFFYVCFSLPLVYIFCCDGTCMKFLKQIAILEVGILIFKSIGWYAYNFKRSNLFSGLVLEFEDWIRDGVQRVEPGQLFGLVLVVVVYFAFKGRIRPVYMFIWIGMLVFLLIISRFRFQAMVSFVTVFVMLYFISNKGTKKLKIRVLLVGAVVVILWSGVVGQLLESASLAGQYASSTVARIQNINHYFGIIKEKHSIFGLGLLDTSNDQAYQLIYQNKWSLYYLDDIGILGGVVRFGVLSLVIYGWLFVLTAKTCLRSYKKKEYKYFPLVIGMAAYMICSCLLLNIYDAQRAYAVPFYLAVISYIDAQIEDEKR